MRPYWLVLIGFGALVLLDIIWLGVVMKGFYKRILGALMLGSPRILPSVLVWLLIALGLVLFVVPKASSFSGVALWGALYGLVVYGVYELTNYALVTGWPVSIVAVDLAWGIFICTATSMLLFWLR